MALSVRAIGRQRPVKAAEVAALAQQMARGVLQIVTGLHGLSVQQFPRHVIYAQQVVIDCVVTLDNKAAIPFASRANLCTHVVAI